ncbi:MAG: hypothetical protein QOJ13_1917 [Gaiellales bacterium]|jgi:uncharacterized membrane protein YdbT with pleckstrin-like domain|nr:hypothetical protein [Gaiellales bacterium]
MTGEEVVWRGTPSWKALLLYYVKWTVIALLPAGLWVILNSTMSDPPSATIFFALTGLGLLLTYTIGWIKKSTTRYMITDRRIQIRTGLISRNDSSTQLDRVQNVNVSQSVFQRLLGIGNIDWDTAGTDAGDSDFTFYGIDDPGSLRQRVDQALNASH